MSKSTVARGASMAASVWGKLDAEVKAQGGSEEDLHLLDKQSGQALITIVATLLVKAGAVARNMYRITVNYALSLPDMIAAGKYPEGAVNQNITVDNFPVKGEGAVDLDAVLLHPNRDIKTDDALKEMDQLGLRPATLPELLAFGAKYPDIQLQFPIVELADVWVSPRGHRCFAYLHGWDGRRRVRLLYGDGGWPAHCRFLAFRKQPLAA